MTSQPINQNEFNQLDIVSIPESATQPQRDDQQTDDLVIIDYTTKNRGKWTNDRRERAVEVALELRVYEMGRKEVKKCWMKIAELTNEVDSHLPGVNHDTVKTYVDKTIDDMQKKMIRNKLSTDTNDSETTLETQSLEQATLELNTESTKAKDRETYSRQLWEKRDKAAKELHFRQLQEERDEQTNESDQGVFGMRDNERNVIPIIVDEGDGEMVIFMDGDDDETPSTTNRFDEERQARQQNFERTMSAIEEERERQHVVLNEMKRMNDSGLTMMQSMVSECKDMMKANLNDNNSNNTGKLFAMQQNFEERQHHAMERFQQTMVQQQQTMMQQQQMFLQQQQTMVQQQQMFLQHFTDCFTKLERDIRDTINNTSSTATPHSHQQSSLPSSTTPSPLQKNKKQ